MSFDVNRANVACTQLSEQLQRSGPDPFKINTRYKNNKTGNARAT
jgi:hypothetical protein